MQRRLQHSRYRRGGLFADFAWLVSYLFWRIDFFSSQNHALLNWPGSLQAPIECELPCKIAEKLFLLIKLFRFSKVKHCETTTI